MTVIAAIYVYYNVGMPWEDPCGQLRLSREPLRPGGMLALDLFTHVHAHYLLSAIIFPRFQEQVYYCGALQVGKVSLDVTGI